YFTGLAEEGCSEIGGPLQAEWLARLETEHDNLRAALGWLLEQDADEFLRLAVAMRFLWNRHGHYAEGRRWLETALARGATAPAHLRSLAVDAIGILARLQGDLPAAHRYTEERLRMGREAGDVRQIGWASHSLGMVAVMQGDLPAGRAYLQESLARGGEAKDDRLIGNAVNGLGEIARHAGAWVEARAL